MTPLTDHTGILTGPRTRVLCADDSRDLTAALAKMMNLQSDLESAGSLHSADNLVSEVISRRADVVVMDLTMPGVNPLHAIRALKVSVPACGIIAFSGFDDSDTIALAKQAGACELVSKVAQAGVLLRAIRLTALRHRELSPRSDVAVER